MSKPLTLAEKEQLLNTTLPTTHENYTDYNNKVNIINDLIADGTPITSRQLDSHFIQLHSYTIVDPKNFAVGGKYKRKSSKRKSMRRRKRR